MDPLATARSSLSPARTTNGNVVAGRVRPNCGWTMPDAVTTPEELIARANEALSNADWDAARRLFAQALERGETPEALEGLAKAAFRLDETELAIDARERAYAAYREADRLFDAARVAIALAWDYRAVRGCWPTAASSPPARRRRFRRGSEGRPATQGSRARPRSHPADAVHSLPDCPRPARSQRHAQRLAR
jgi:tetratricopeptide (TPR) repeat protein